MILVKLMLIDSLGRSPPLLTEKPLFVVQGLNDPRVPYTEAEQIVATLQKNGTPVWFLMTKDEGHGFAKKSNADFLFYASVEFVRVTLLK